MKIIINIFFIVITVVIFTYLLIHSKTYTERKEELIKKGYNILQVDSIIKKENDMLYTTLHLAG